MTDHEKSEFTPSKLPVTKSTGGLMVPLAVVLVGALVIFGITKMLSSNKTHRDLVRELQSKTFGNRWVAAFELSKLVAGKKISEPEIPWLVENLANLYQKTVDHRTRNFIIITLGSLKHPNSLPTLELALDDPDLSVSFNAIVSIGNLPPPLTPQWPRLIAKLESLDEGIRHAAILTLATKKAPDAQKLIEPKLNDPAISVRYGAALALVQYHSQQAAPLIAEILMMETHPQFNSSELLKIRLNLISVIGREKWQIFRPQLEKITRKTRQLPVETTAKKALNLLKI